MRILVVSEGKHELGDLEQDSALVTLVERLLGRPAEFACEKVSSPKVRIHRRRGEPGGFWKRALVWIRYAETEAFDALVLVIDQDGRRERQQEIDNAQQDEHFQLPRALGVAIRTFDAWLLADENALTSVLRSQTPRQKDPESIRDPKALCRELLDNSSISLSPSEVYAAAAKITNLATLESRCPKGFRPFAARVRRL